jgi:hypothetical protein
VTWLTRASIKASLSFDKDRDTQGQTEGTHSNYIRAPLHIPGYMHTLSDTNAL